MAAKLHESINLKLLKLRGSGKDIIPALNPIFAAMDTGKTGAIDSSEFKTCLLALGIKSSMSDIVELFGLYDGLHLRSGQRVAYKGFLKSLVDALPEPEGYVAPKPAAFRSRLVAPAAAPPPPKPTYEPVNRAVFLPVVGSINSAGQKLSDEVGDYEAKIAGLEETLQNVCDDLEDTMAQVAATRALKEKTEAGGEAAARRLGNEVEAKNFDIASLNTDISDLTDSLNSLREEKARLQREVASKERTAAKNLQRKKDKDTMIGQLTKATKENEVQLAELQAVADELLAELEDATSKIDQSNSHIGALLHPEQPPQSVALRVSRRPLSDEAKDAVRTREEQAEEQHRINRMK